jgi:hypothetical protein
MTFPFASAIAVAPEAPCGRSFPPGAAAQLPAAAPLSVGWISRCGIVSAWVTLFLTGALVALRIFG